jgi:hypothetical protein
MSGHPLRVVDVSSLAPPYRPQYAILRDKPRQEVVAFARKHPDCFVFPFVTGPVDHCPDYRWLFRKWDSIRMRIAKPIYVGNLEPMEEAMRQIVSKCLDFDLSECDEVFENG